MIFPVIEMSAYKQKVYKISNYIPTVIENGSYFVYKTKLQKEGFFKELLVFNKNDIKAKDFILRDLVKNSSLFAKEIDYSFNKLKAKKVRYLTKEYNISTNYAIYYEKNGLIKGGGFKIYGKSFSGFGKSFEVDKKNNVYADKIEYVLKVK
jgi:hypothetical protein